MANRIQPVSIYDFTGGLNARSEAFQLAPNEVPEILNMEIDPRGGVYTRKGWERWTTETVGALTWNPRNAFLHELSSGAQHAVVAVDNKLYSSSGAAWAQITGAVCNADPHFADFTPWGDNLYVACGVANQSVKTTGTGAATLLTASGPTWQNDYTVGGSGFMPRADLAVVHGDRLFVAATQENGVNYPHRLRWSHPSNVEAWAETDFQDIGTGGTRITALVPIAEGLLVFKTDSIWLWYGSDEDTFQLSQVTSALGVASPTSVVKSESEVFFFSWPLGVYRIARETVVEVSESVRSILEDVPASQASNVWLGWMDRRLWVSVPYDPSTPPTDVTRVLVYDPRLNRAGGWTMFQGGDGKGLGPFVTRAHAGSDAPLLAFARSVQTAMKVNARDSADDNFNGTPVGFAAAVRTPWVAGELPALRKSWRRPDLILRNLNNATTLTVESFTDFDSASIDRSTAIPVDAQGDVANWGAFNWGDGTMYGAGASTTSIVRGSTFGLARALQIRLSAPAGATWGLNNITLKMVPRRVR